MWIIENKMSYSLKSISKICVLNTTVRIYFGGQFSVVIDIGIDRTIEDITHDINCLSEKNLIISIEEFKMALNDGQKFQMLMLKVDKK